MEQVEELTEEQKAHIAVLRSKFFRAVSVVSVVGVIIFMVVMRFTAFNFTKVEDYESYVTHKDKFMRFNAAKALGKFKDQPKAIVLLMQLLDDPERQVRWHASASLALLKDKNATPKLIKKLEKEEDIQAKSFYIYALGQINDSTSVEPLYKMFEDNIKIKTDASRIVVFSVIQSLAFMDNEEAVSIIPKIKKQVNNSILDKDAKDKAIKLIENKGNVLK